MNNNPPVIQNFAAVFGSGDVWFLEGNVIANNAGGLTVTFAGLNGLLGNTTATVTANGSFCVGLALPYGTQGTVAANVTDSWGQAADEAWSYLN